MTRSQSTPASSQIIWLEGRVQELEAERDKLKDALSAIAWNTDEDDIANDLANRALEALKETK